MDEETNNQSKNSPPKEGKRNYIQIIMAVGVISMMAIVFVLMARYNFSSQEDVGSPSYAQDTEENQNSPDLGLISEEEMNKIYEARIAESGDKDIPTKEEMRLLEESLKDYPPGFEPVSEEEMNKIYEARIAENGDKDTLTMEEEEALQASLSAESPPSEE